MVNITKTTRVVEGCTVTTIPREIVALQEPVIFKGAVSSWELVGLSNQPSLEAVNYLKSHYNNKPSLINVGHPGINGRYFYDEEIRSLNYDTIRMNVDDALDLILKSKDDPKKPSYYISSNALSSHFPSLTSKVPLTLPRKQCDYSTYPSSVKIWVGTRSLATCHYDSLDNLACVAAGLRRFTLFPPSQFKNLYFGPLEPTPGGQAISMVNFDNPDYKKYPLFRKAELEGQIAELEPGDVIYIPSMWMHHVEGLSDFNILVNYWWNDAPKYTGAGMNVLTHALLTLRDKPEHERQGWKYLFDHYIFGDSDFAGAHLPDHARGVLGTLDEVSARQLRAQLLNKLNR